MALNGKTMHVVCASILSSVHSIRLHSCTATIELRKKIQRNTWLLSHSDFTKFNFGRGSAPEPAGGAYSAPPDLLAVFKGAASKRREGKGKTGGRKKEVKRKGREGRREGK